MKPTLVVLTGAGIHLENIFGTEDPEFSTEDFARDPKKVHQYYNIKRSQLSDPKIQPNGAHLALAELERNWPGNFLLITQNQDDLHSRAGSKNLIHLQGELKKVRCLVCNQVRTVETDLKGNELCSNCKAVGSIRPHLVWSGEVPLELEPIYDTLKMANIFCAIGTSGWVFPAAGFVGAVPAHCRRFEINSESTGMSHSYNERFIGKATEQVPLWIASLLDRFKGSLLFSEE